MSPLCDDIEKFGKAVGNASRYKLVEALFKQAKTVSQLATDTQLSQPLVSQHLKVLRENGLVSDERRGKEVVYSLNTAHLLGLLRDLSREVKHRQQ